MRLATYVVEGTQRVGTVVDEGRTVVDLGGSTAGADIADIVADWDDLAGTLGKEEGRKWRLDEVHLLAPIPRPRRDIFCVGKNYRDHAAEFAASGYDQSDSSTQPPTKPVVFTKTTGSVIGPGADIELDPSLTTQLDYEAELAVIIGRGGVNITATDAKAHVWGYTIINDVTARDRQRDHVQWFLGKSMDTFCPMGPYAVSADEVDLTTATIECRVNGELRQCAAITDLIFDIPSLIETISSGLTLRAGDIIATGTPAGVGLGFTPPRFLQPGDLVEASITGLGTLRNAVRVVKKVS